MSKISTYLLAVAMACLMTAGRLSAADAAKKADGPKQAAKRLEESFKKSDKNNDGQLDFNEFKGKRRRPEALEKAEVIFKLIDKDHNLEISLEEFKHKPAEARFKTLDRNGDGKLTFDEIKGRRTRPEEIERIEQNFKRMDKDGDLKLTLEEYGRPRAAGGRKVRPDKQRILGTWEVVQKNGDTNTEEKGNQCIFTADKLTVKPKDGDPFELKYKLAPAKKPKQIDMVVEIEGQTYVLKSIYLFQRDTLKICGAAGLDRPRPSEFQAKPEEQNLYVLKRVRKKKK